MIRECVICGEKFESNRAKKFCSSPCKLESERRRSKRNRIPIPPKVKNCVICGKEFETKRNASCCSHECTRERDRANARRYSKPKGNVQHICDVCGAEFMGHSLAKSCSDYCRRKKKNVLAKYLRENNPNYWKEYYEKNKDRVEAVKEEYRRSNRGTFAYVSRHLKYNLGFEPPKDLIEEATALRLLNRLLRDT